MNSQYWQLDRVPHNKHVCLVMVTLSEMATNFNELMVCDGHMK